MRSTILLLAALATVACGSKDATVTQVTTPPDTAVTTTSVVFPGGTVSAKIAATDSARETGLMNVTSLGADSGMLFVWAADHDSLDVSFWMKDTPIPLSIAFINASMTVVNVDDMAAETLTLHKPKGTFRYAIEVNEGWLAAHGVAAGTTVQFALPAGTIVDP